VRQRQGWSLSLLLRLGSAGSIWGMRYLIHLLHVFDELGLLAFLQLAVLDYLLGKDPKLIYESSFADEGVSLQVFYFIFHL
jgi:hypothetical protein